MARKKSIFGSKTPEMKRREAAIKEYRATLKELQGTSKRLKYELETTGLPKANSPSWAFAGMSTEEITQTADEFRQMRREEIQEELKRTQGQVKGTAAHDNVSALMEAVDPSQRDRLRDLIEENYDMMETAADIFEKFGGEVLGEWVDNYGEDELIEDLWEDEDFEDIF